VNIENVTRYAKFQGVSSLVLHFPENFGGDTTRISFIGLRGEATEVISMILSGQKSMWVYFSLLGVLLKINLQ
jgi:hypothetical protein